MTGMLSRTQICSMETETCPTFTRVKNGNFYLAFFFFNLLHLSQNLGHMEGGETVFYSDDVFDCVSIKSRFLDS